VSRRNPQFRQSTVGGEALFSWLRRGGTDGISVDGIIFNPFGPGPTVTYDLSVLDQILAAPERPASPPPLP
jgi:hypothetical protein